MREWQSVSLAYVGLSQPKLPLDVQMRNGDSFHLTEFYDIETLWQVYFHGAYEARATDRIIIDAGANIGLFTCWAARVAPEARVYSFEPAPSTFQRLQQHVRANGLSNRVTCFPVAVGGTREAVEILFEGQSSQRSRVAAAAGAGAGGVSVRPLFSQTARVEKVSLTSILDLVRRDAQRPTIDLLKMDIESCEYEALMPERLEGVARLQLEYHPPESAAYSLTALMQHIEECGFRLARRIGRDDYGLLWYERD